MSTPEEPTHRIPEGEPPRTPVAREREVIEDDPGWRTHVDDQLRSLRNALFGVGLVALLGVALGVYILVTDDDDGDNGRDAASASEVRDLEQRVDRLGAQLDDRAGANDVNKLERSQSELAERVDALEDDGGDAEQLQQSVDDLSTDLEELSQRVEELEQQQQQDQP